MKVATIGECMIEFTEAPSGEARRGFGGDTLNTAIYLARLGVDVDYVTILGDDPFSDEMLRAWRDEGVGVDLVRRMPGWLPGLYTIRTDADGEREFHYWRDRAPAREMFGGAFAEDMGARLAGYDLIYFSGITLSILDEPARARLVELAARIRAAGGRIAFDMNYRPRGWPDHASAKAAYAAMLGGIDIALPTFEDERTLFGDADERTCVERLHRAGVREVAVKLGANGASVSTAGRLVHVPALDVADPVDTTAAGDSFNAGYLAARLGGDDPVKAAAKGNRLAAAVIRHRGAIIARAAMPAKDVSIDVATVSPRPVDQPPAKGIL